MMANSEPEPGSAVTLPLTVTVVFSPAPRQVVERRLTLPAGSTVAQALRAASIDVGQVLPALGIWGRKVALDQPLRNQDRIEIYRPLKVDPKVARRERFVKQGVKKAGLFAQRRAGAKPGY